MDILKKARLYIPDGKGGESDSVDVQFNPGTLDYSIGGHKKAYKNAAAKKTAHDEGTKKPQIDPTRDPGMSSLSVKLFYHTYTNDLVFSDVRDEIRKIHAFMRRTGDGETAASPSVGFAWGTINFQGALESLSISYQMFAPDGTPVQAEVSITIWGQDVELREGAWNTGALRKAGDALQRGWRTAGGIPPAVQWLYR